MKDRIDEIYLDKPFLQHQRPVRRTRDANLLYAAIVCLSAAVVGGIYFIAWMAY